MLVCIFKFIVVVSGAHSPHLFIEGVFYYNKKLSWATFLSQSGNRKTQVITSFSSDTSQENPHAAAANKQEQRQNQNVEAGRASMCPHEFSMSDGLEGADKYKVETVVTLNNLVIRH